MTDRSFKYPDEQWRRMEEVVERAGGPAAKEKFTAGRATFEEEVAVWRQRIAHWNGYTWDPGRPPKYRRVKKAAVELKAALDDLNLPDLLWKTPEPRGEATVTKGNLEEADRAKTPHEILRAEEHIRRRVAMMEEDWEEAHRAAYLKRYDGFREALDHISRLAAMMEDMSIRLVVDPSIKNPPRKQKFVPRNWFICELWLFWRDELRLRVSPSPMSRFVQFAGIASESVCACTHDTIVNVIRKRPRVFGR
jgi:hypothetical protein